MRLNSTALLFIGGLVLTQTAWGSAFFIGELGARAEGMGGAFTAVADDPSAIYFNPAGIAFVKGTQLQMDSLVVVGLFRFHPSSTPPGTVIPANDYSGSIKPHFIPVASMYATKQISDKLTLGFGVFTPFGLAANWTNFNDSDPASSKYVGRFAGTRARLESFWFQPTVAYKLSEHSAISVGVAYVHTHLLYEQSILNPNDDGKTFGLEVAAVLLPGQNPVEAARSIARLLPEGRFRLAGTSNKIGFNAGYIYKNPSGWSFGASWRSAVTHHLKGQASFAFTQNSALSPFLPDTSKIPSLFPTQAATGILQTPSITNLGVAKDLKSDLKVAFDFSFQDFSRFKTLPINFSNTSGTATPAERSLAFDFRNSFQTHLGAEKKMNELTTVRAGFIFDHSPVPDKSVGPLFPDNSRVSFTIGGTRKRGNKEFTFFYQGMKFFDRAINVAANNNNFTNGLYHSYAHLGGLALRMHLGKE